MNLDQRIEAAAQRYAKTPLPHVICPVKAEPILICPRYRMIVSDRICAQCKSDPMFRQSLFLSYMQGQEAQDGRCSFRGASCGRTEVTCCGGSRVQTVALFKCSRKGQVSEPDCWVCKDRA